MNISYKVFNINNLEYKFNPEIPSQETFSETYHFNLNSTTVKVNRSNEVAFIELKIEVKTELGGRNEEFRSLSFDFNYIYKMGEFEKLSDDEIQDFVIKYGFENAISAVKDVIKHITSIDYQPTINIDIPSFPMQKPERMTNS